jgi:hypothetical protein
MYLSRSHAENIFPSWTVVVWRHHVYVPEFHRPSCDSAGLEVLRAIHCANGTCSVQGRDSNLFVITVHIVPCGFFACHTHNNLPPPSKADL